MNFELNTCEKEYTKDPEIKRDDILALLKWVRENSRLPEVTEYMLIQCYQASYYSFVKCQKLVQSLYDFKNRFPELFTGQDYQLPNSEMKFFDVHYLFVLPHITLKGDRIIYLGLKNFDACNFNTTNYASMLLKCLFTIVLEIGSCPGYIVISDAFGFHFGHLRRMNFSTLRKLVQFTTDAIPIRMKAVHMIRTHRISSYIFTVLRPFMSKELNDSIFMHRDQNKLFDIIPKEYIPKDLGGTLPHTRDEYNEMQRKKVEFFSDEVNQELQKRIRVCEKESS